MENIQILNIPREPEKEKEKETETETEIKTQGQEIAAVVLGFFIFIILFYVISLSFDFTPFIAALILSSLTLYTSPKIIKLLEKTPILIYYSIFLTITLFMSIDDYKNNNNMMLLLVSHVLVSVAVFFTNNTIISCFFIFMNFYIVLRIFSFFTGNPEQISRRLLNMS